MRNERKAAKKRAHRKDYVRKRNINRNARKVTHEFERPIFKSTTVKKKDGTLEVETTNIGSRKVVRRTFGEGHRDLLKPGDGILPKSRKFAKDTPPQKPVPEYRDGSNGRRR